MADDLELNAGSGGGTIRALSTAADIDYPAGVVAYPTTLTAGANVVQIVDATHGLPVQPQTGSAWAVTGTFWQATQPVSAASLPLPTGAAVAAKQPAIGTAGNPSADVLSVQGVSGGQAVAVDGSAVTQPVLVSGTVTVDQAGQWVVIGPAAHDVPASGAPILAGAFASTATPAAVSADGDVVHLWADRSGRLQIGDGGGSLTVDNGGTFAVQTQAATTGGYSAYSFLSTAAVQAANIKASAGQVYRLSFFNNSGTIAYVRLYDKATTPGTGDTPVWRGLIPANTSGAGWVEAFPDGLVFSTGIGLRVTAAVADSDNTALAANAVLGNVAWK